MRYKICRYGAVVEGVTLLHSNEDSPIQLLDGGDEYLVKSTGEVRRVNHGDSRVSDVKSLRKTFRDLRRLIIANTSEHPERIRWVTLTYRENMTDAARLYRDWVLFWKRFTYRWGAAEYINVVEPQARGAFHLHVIVIFPNRAPFIPNAELAECWGHGFVKVKAVDSGVNLAKYLSAYLTDIEAPDDAENFDKEVQVEGQPKRLVKSGRLKFYKKGMHLYRHSRGLVVPQEVMVTADEYNEAVNGLSLSYECEYEYTDEATGFRQYVVRQFFESGGELERAED